MMPLTAAMPYERAVDVARGAELLPPAERGRLVAYVIGWAGLTDRLLAHLVATRPELVATAMLDKSLTVPPAPAVAYGFDVDGEPVAPLELVS
jgi:hypothetical protein